MLGLPQLTEVKRPMPKVGLYKRFDWNASQRERFDADVARLDFANWVSPRTVPAVAEGAEVKEIYVVEVTLKCRDFDIKNIALLGKSISQRIVYLLSYDGEAMLALYHTKLFTSPWQSLESITLSITGLNLDAIWENIVFFIGQFSVEQDKSLTEQIKVDEERARLVRQIESLERLMRSTSQPCRQRGLYSEIKKLKGGIEHESR